MDAGSEQGRLVVRVVKNPPLNAGDAKDTGSIPGSGRLPWRRKWQPTPVLLPGKFHGQRSLAGYSPRGRQELDTAEHTLLSRVGRGRRGASICCTCPKGGPAMRGYLVAVLLSAVCLYYVLHCILWRTNDYGVTPMDMKQRSKIQPCSSKPAFASLLRYHHFHPFLCAADFKNTVSFYGSDKFDLPYGIRASATYFRLALSKLQNCGLFDEFDNVPCKKCVVVGNGGILKNKTLGEKIDSYDIIIRMNNGPVLGHEEEVGRRTTFRLFYPESVFSDPDHNDPNTTVILTAFKPLDLKWLWELLTGGKINPNGFWKEPALNLIYKPYQIRILDPYITRMAAHELLHFPKVFPKNEKPKHPTTGIIAITLAFHICHEVHLAGFKYNFSDLKSPLHYYGNATMSLMTENEYHNVTAEQLFLKDIIEKNFVTDLTQQ